MRIEFKNDVTRALEEAEGSDGRMNTSSRSDGRAYYNSRDQGRCFTVVFDHPSSAAGEYSVYCQNTSSDRTLVISSIGVHAAEDARIKLAFVTGTAAGGSVITAVNLNRISSNAAEANCRQGAAGDAITGLTPDGVIDFAWITPSGHEEMELSDRVRLGQNDAIAIEMDQGAGDFAGVIFAYYE